MDRRITNKRVSITDIIKIAEVMESRALYYRNIEKKEKQKKDEAAANKQYYNAKYCYTKVKYTIQYNGHDSVTKEDDIDWFKGELINTPNTISEVTLYFHGSEDDSNEMTTITFYQTSIYFDTSIKNMSSNYIGYTVENMLNNLPPRFDELVKYDTRRKIVPASIISIPLAIVLGFVLLFVGKAQGISILNNRYILSAITLAVAFVGALLIPTKNTGLYRYIKVDTYYGGYNDKTSSSIRKYDYEDYKSKCEIAIGPNHNLPKVRDQIESNYKKAKKILPLALIALAIAVVLFFII